MSSHLPSHRSEIKGARRKWAVRCFWAIPSLPVLLFTILVLQKPHQISERLLRLGGGLVKSATQNVEKVALFGGVIVILLWAGILLVASREE